MIYQLPNGRIIELSLEQFLNMNDAEINELNGLGSAYTSDCHNPNAFSYAKGSSAKSDTTQAQEEIHEYEPRLDEIDDADKLNDADFNTED
jgi:hypothetical protein|tara:strand:- start:8097 stop:8369 length:273 start_codon:yes stop_codon:yes gene_type:complete